MMEFYSEEHKKCVNEMVKVLEKNDITIDCMEFVLEMVKTNIYSKARTRILRKQTISESMDELQFLMKQLEKEAARVAALKDEKKNQNINNVDKTIDAICIWIQDETKSIYKSKILPEMTNALAELIKTRDSEKINLQ